MLQNPPGLPFLSGHMALKNIWPWSLARHLLLPDLPHSLPFTDKWTPRGDIRVTEPSCHRLRVWSRARVLCVALERDANKARRGWTETSALSKNPLLHTVDGRAASPQHTPSLAIWLGTCWCPRKKEKTRGEERETS